MLKMKLSYRDQSDQVLLVMKTKTYSDVTDRTSEFYVENDTKLS